MSELFFCHLCSKQVSNNAGNNFILRALTICPECFEKEQAEVFRLTADLEKAKGEIRAWENWYALPTPEKMRVIEKRGNYILNSPKE